MAKIASKIEAIVEKYQKELEKMGIQVGEIYLYGSHAHGRPHEGSDIDLIVVSTDFKKMSLLERMELLGIASGRVGEPIQSYGFTPEEIDQDLVPPFLNEVLKHEALAVYTGEDACATRA